MTEPREATARPLLALIAIGVVPCLLGLDSLIAAIGGWRPVGTIESILSLALALVLLVLFAVTATSLRHRLGARWRECVLLGLVAVPGWALLEITAHRLEAIRRPDGPFHTRGRNIHNVFHPDPAYLPGIFDVSNYRTGPDGIRAPAPPEDEVRRILTIGGSTTECVYLDDRETWPALLAREDAVWSGNVGISGFDLEDHFQFIRESPLLADIDLLVVQPGINDCWRFLAREVDTMDYGRFKPEGITAPPAAPPTPTARPPWWTRSRVIQLYHTIQRVTPPREQYEGIGGGEYAIRREKRAAAAHTDELPDLEAGLAAYEQRVRDMVAACTARGVPVLFTTQAVVWRADLSKEAEARCWFGWLPDGRYLTLAALREAIDQYNATLVATCADLGVPCVDLSPLHGSEAYFYDDCHFTEAGARAVAEFVRPAVEQALGEIK